jgi:hypothetical protein
MNCAKLRVRQCHACLGNTPVTSGYLSPKQCCYCCRSMRHGCCHNNGEPYTSSTGYDHCSRLVKSIGMTCTPSPRYFSWRHAAAVHADNLLQFEVLSSLLQTADCFEISNVLTYLAITETAAVVQLLTIHKVCCARGSIHSITVAPALLLPAGAWAHL